MFANNRYAKVWKVDNSGKFPKAQISISRKKDDGEFETRFSDWVVFYGKAKDKAADLCENDRIKILSCGVENWFNKETDKRYYSFMIFDYENAGTSESSNTTTSNKAETKPVAEAEVNDDDDLPF